MQIASLTHIPNSLTVPCSQMLQLLLFPFKKFIWFTELQQFLNNELLLSTSSTRFCLSLEEASVQNSWELTQAPAIPEPHHGCCVYTYQILLRPLVLESMKVRGLGPLWPPWVRRSWQLTCASWRLAAGDCRNKLYKPEKSCQTRTFLLSNGLED